MPPQSKRRRLSLLTLPFVVAVGFLIVAKLAAWQRSDPIAELAECISREETRGAIEAVHKLATLPNPPIPVLVNAAASDGHELARAAQASIDGLLRRWQRDVESQNRYNAMANQLGELSKSLADTKTAFSEADYAWLASAERKILRIADEFPPTETPLVAVHCDAVLTAIGAGRFPEKLDKSPGFVDFDDVIDAKHDRDASSRPEIAPSSETAQNVSSVANGTAQSAENAPAPYHPPLTTEPLLHSTDDTAGSSPDVPLTNELRYRNSGSADNGTTDRLSSPSGIAPRLGASPPIFRILPAMPINILPKDGEASNRVTPNSRTAAQSDPLAADSRELLKTWLASENGDTQPIERELAKRGFGKLSKRLVRQFFSDNPQDRTRLVDNVLAQPGGGSEAWLLLLASDTDPDVRLFAVTFMATSNNAALVEKAWQMAIRDHDPRVADLAGRLRERRNGPVRR